MNGHRTFSLHESVPREGTTPERTAKKPLSHEPCRRVYISLILPVPLTGISCKQVRAPLERTYQFSHKILMKAHVSVDEHEELTPGVFRT